MISAPERFCPTPQAEQLPAPSAGPTAKPRIAIFSLTSCEGCSLAILELEDELLAILGAVEIVNFREGMSERAWDIDIGFVDGAVSTPHDEQQIRRLREHCKTLVAIGACACLGGVNTLKNHQSEEAYRRYVYGDRARLFPTLAAQPLSAVVKVDYELPGCPMTNEEFLRFVKCMLAGRPFKLPNYAVCVECKRRGILCRYESGDICLGPVARAGCDAICPQYGTACEACRGIVSDEALAALGRNMRERYDVPLDDVVASLRLFGASQKGELP
ncbi:NAD-reducing hydrogenase HoxS subunit delta [Phycisphaerae bacterium RAS1]|nr:NAD-reducing hydrogenase HoxS subunit delta [Phycisphaerae bacterium RAS1]